MRYENKRVTKLIQWLFIWHHNKVLVKGSLAQFITQIFVPGFPAYTLTLLTWQKSSLLFFFLISYHQTSSLLDLLKVLLFPGLSLTSEHLCCCLLYQSLLLPPTPHTCIYFKSRLCSPKHYLFYSKIFQSVFLKVRYSLVFPKHLYRFLYCNYLLQICLPARMSLFKTWGCYFVFVLTQFLA